MFVYLQVHHNTLLILCSKRKSKKQCQKPRRPHSYRPENFDSMPNPNPSKQPRLNFSFFFSFFGR